MADGDGVKSFFIGTLWLMGKISAAGQRRTLLSKSQHYNAPHPRFIVEIKQKFVENLLSTVDNA